MTEFSSPILCLPSSRSTSSRSVTSPSHGYPRVDPPRNAGGSGEGPGGGQRNGEQQDDGDVAIEKTRKIERPRRYKVVFHNDDYTTREFVISVLMRFFEKDESEATFIMLSVHHRGHGVAGVFPKDIAESKVDQVTKHARAQGMPLLLTAEPE